VEFSLQSHGYVKMLQGGSGLSQTHDLASTLEGGPEVTVHRTHETGTVSSNHLRSVLMIAFQFAYEAQTRETCAAVAHQYVCSVVASIQHVAIALAPAHPAPRQSPTSANAAVLARHVLQSYRLNLGINLVEIDAGDDDSQFEIFWQHSDAILCCAWKVASISFIFREVFYNTVNHQPKVGT
jgi:homeobox-leucine zipper protein